jgi:hypothetical protein
MNTIQLNIEKSQFATILETLTDSEKMEIFQMLKKSFMVDDVRQEMYERNEQYL